MGKLVHQGRAQLQHHTEFTLQSGGELFAKGGQRQATAALHIGQGQRRVCGLQQLLTHAVFLQAVEGKGFELLLCLLQLLKADAQAGAQKNFHRLAQQLAQIVERQFGGGLGILRGEGLVCSGAKRSCIRHGGRCGYAHRSMQPGPLCIKGLERRVLQKIGFRVGLQRLLLGLAWGRPGSVEVVEQLGHQHRRGLLGVVGGAVALPANEQALARRQQGFQKQVAVVLAARAVTGAPAGPHQVKVARRGLARVVAVVHAEQTNRLEGDGAHGHERAKLHAAAKKPLLQTALVHLPQPMLAHHLQRQRRLQMGLGAGLLPTLQRLLQALQQALFGVVAGLEKSRDQRAHGGAPLLGRLVAAERLQGLVHRVHPVQQMADHAGVQALDGGLRQRATPGAATTDGIAQQQAAQAKGPGVLVAACHAVGKAPALAVIGVQPPAHTGAGEPSLQLRDVGRAQAKTLAHGRDLKQPQPIDQRDARIGQFEQLLQRLHQGRLARRGVGHRVGNVARLAAREAAKHRMDMGRKGLHVGHHDHHIAGMQRGVGLEPRQQAVVQHLHLALGRVGAHQGDGVIARSQGQRLGRHRLQVQDGRLQQRQLRRRVRQRGRVDKGVHPHHAATVLLDLVKAV